MYEYSVDDLSVRKSEIGRYIHTNLDLLLQIEVFISFAVVTADYNFK